MKPHLNSIKLITITRPFIDVHISLNTSISHEHLSEIESFNFEGNNNIINEESMKGKVFLTSNTVLNTVSFMNKCSYRKFILDCFTLNKLIPSDRNEIVNRLINDFYQKNFINRIETNNNSLIPCKLHLMYDGERKKTFNIKKSNEKLFLGKTKLNENLNIKEALKNNLINKKQQFFFIDVSDFSKEFQIKELLYYINLIKSRKKECKIVLFLWDNYDISTHNDIIDEIIDNSFIVIMDNQATFEIVLKQTQVLSNNSQEFEEINTKVLLNLDELKSISLVKLDKKKIVDRSNFNIGLGLNLQNLKTLFNYFHLIKTTFLGGFLSKLIINEPSENCFSTALYALNKMIYILNNKEFSLINKANTFIKEKYSIFNSVNDVSSQSFPAKFKKIKIDYGIKTLATILNTETNSENSSPKYHTKNRILNKIDKKALKDRNLLVKTTNVTLPNIHGNKSFNLKVPIQSKYKFNSQLKSMGLLGNEQYYTPFKKIAKFEGDMNTRLITSSDVQSQGIDRSIESYKITDEILPITKISFNKIGIFKKDTLLSNNNVLKTSAVTFDYMKTGNEKILQNEGIYVPHKRFEVEETNNI